MVKREGKVYATVKRLLESHGMDPSGLEIATLGRGTDHLIVLNGEPVGDYNHRSKSLFLYSEVVNAPE